MEDAIQHAVSAQVDRPEIIMESGEVLLRSGRNFRRPSNICGATWR